MPRKKAAPASGKKKAVIAKENGLNVLSKKTVYVILTMFFFFLLSNLIYNMLFVAYPDFFIPMEYIFCPFCKGVFFELYSPLQMLFVFFGTIAGYYVGKFWWQMVYVQQEYRGVRKNKIRKLDW